MSLEIYIAFVLATALLIVIPGPNVTLIVAHAVAHGPRRALSTVFGTECAQAVQLAFVALGMTTLILSFAPVFEWVRWLGVAYLIWLGIQRWRAHAGEASVSDVPDLVPHRVLFFQGFVVGLTNPKTWLFYAAFFPQFVDPAGPVGLQLAMLSVTYLAIATALDGGYALLTGRARGWLRLTARQRLLDRVTGSILIGAGLWLALARRG
jgi:threonine/homoserine/homoserine lactone efflux protein